MTKMDKIRTIFIIMIQIMSAVNRVPVILLLFFFFCSVYQHFSQFFNSKLSILPTFVWTRHENIEFLFKYNKEKLFYLLSASILYFSIQVGVSCGSRCSYMYVTSPTGWFTTFYFNRKSTNTQIFPSKKQIKKRLAELLAQVHKTNTLSIRLIYQTIFHTATEEHLTDLLDTMEWHSTGYEAPFYTGHCRSCVKVMMNSSMLAYWFSSPRWFSHEWMENIRNECKQ